MVSAQYKLGPQPTRWVPPWKLKRSPLPLIVLLPCFVALGIREPDPHFFRMNLAGFMTFGDTHLVNEIYRGARCNGILRVERLPLGIHHYIPMFRAPEPCLMSNELGGSVVRLERHHTCAFDPQRLVISLHSEDIAAYQDGNGWPDVFEVRISHNLCGAPPRQVTGNRGHKNGGDVGCDYMPNVFGEIHNVGFYHAACIGGI